MKSKYYKNRALFECFFSQTDFLSLQVRLLHCVLTIVETSRQKGKTTEVLFLYNAKKQVGAY